MVELDSLYTFGDYFRYGLDLAVFIICVWVYLATRHLSLVLFLLMMICQFGLEMATISYYNRDNSFSTGLSSITTSEIMTSEDLMFERMIEVGWITVSIMYAIAIIWLMTHFRRVFMTNQQLLGVNQAVTERHRYE